MIIILFGTVFSKNRGVNALTRATISLVEQINPKEKIVLIGSGCKKSIKFNDIQFYPRPSIKKISFLYILSFVSRKYVIRKILNDNTPSNRIMVLDLSEGDSFTDIYGYPRFCIQMFTKTLFKKISSKYVLLPQTIGPFENPILKMIAGTFMKKCDVVIARDNESREYAENIIQRPCKFCYDLAFYMPYKNVPALDSGRFKNKIGINVNGLLWIGGYTRKNQFNLLTDYCELLVQISTYFINEGYNLVFIPHTYGEGISEDDLTASIELKSVLAEKGKDIEIISEKYSEQELKWILSSFDFFIGSRMHSCIGAISTGVPTIGISYSRKFKGVFESVGIPNCVLDPRKFEMNEILESVKEIFEMRESIKKKIGDVMPLINLKIEETIKESIN